MAATRVGASNTIAPRSSAAIRASRSRRSRPGARQEPLERPARPGDARTPATAASTADAPGIGTTVPPSPAQAATRSPPGSLTPGVPASVTSARSAPPRRCSSSAAARAARSGRGSSSSGSSMRVACQQPVRVPRVLGRDERHGREDLERPERDVGEVADRGGHDVQGPAGSRPTPAPLPAAVIRRGPTPAGDADRGSRRPASAARAWRSAAPGA